MANFLGDPPLRAQVVDARTGEFSRLWTTWIRELFERVGKNSGDFFLDSKALIAPKLVESTQTTQYTAPVGTQAVIDSFMVTNTDTVVRRLSLNLVPSGGSVSSGNLIVPALAVKPGETVSIAILYQKILEAGDMVSTLASTPNKILIQMSGREVSV